MSRRITISAGSGLQVSVSFPVGKQYALSRVSDAHMLEPVRRSAAVLASRIAAHAPHRTGDLQRGIIVSPRPERTSVAGKVVHDIYMEPRMNDTFVKYSKAGKRYYYPASQEYGFRIGRVRRKPGLYYMRDTAAEYSAEHFAAVSQGVDRILEEL